MSIPWEVTGPASKPLLLMQPNVVDGRPNALGRQGETVEIAQGSRFVDTGLAKPTGRTEFVFRCETPAELAFLESFFDARQGKVGAFWVPTWQWEFDFLGYVEPNAGVYAIWIPRVGYVESFFPLGSQYRQFAILRGTTYRIFTVTSCVAAVTPTVDRLNCTSTLASAPDLPQVNGPLASRDDTYRMLWLRWARFDQDERTAESINANDGTADLALAVAELPAEVPL